jgi:hypothetical protein
VKRAVFARDGGRCGFVGKLGRPAAKWVFGFHPSSRLRAVAKRHCNIAPVIDPQSIRATWLDFRPRDAEIVRESSAAWSVMRGLSRGNSVRTQL